MKWELINTAPTDGSWILVARGDQLGVVRWNGKYWSLGAMCYFDRPKHWMPVPEPPTTENTVTKEEKIAEHEQIAAHFAEDSHKFESPISDALSALAEAHQQYAEALRRTKSEQATGEERAA